MIVTLTMNPAVDKSTTVDKLVPEKKLRCSEMQVEAGGGGINVSKALKKLGGDSVALFYSGGLNGKILEKSLERLGIHFAAFNQEAETRENIVVTETSTNAQYRFVLPGSPLPGSAIDEITRYISALSPKPAIIVASGSLPPGTNEDFYAVIARLCKTLSIKFILDTSGEPLKLAAKEGVFLLKPNHNELCKLAGVENLHLHEVDDAAMGLIRAGYSEAIVVSMGPSGALFITKDGAEHVPAPAVKKISTVGAGDSMVAGMAWMLSKGKSWKEIVRFGVACGTASTMNPGTQLFDPDDVNRLYHWINKFGDRYKQDLDGK